jgi:hypothetical protein
LQRSLSAVDQHKLTADVGDELLLESGAFGLECFALLDRKRRGCSRAVAGCVKSIPQRSPTLRLGWPKVDSLGADANAAQRIRDLEREVERLNRACATAADIIAGQSNHLIADSADAERWRFL